MTFSSSPLASRLGFLAVLNLLCAVSLTAQTPSFVIFDAPDAGVGNLQGTFPACISQTGVVAGHYLDANTKAHPFFRQTNGQITEFEVPGLTGSLVLGINAHGQMVGNGTRTNVVHGWLRNPNGHFVMIDPPGSTFTSPGAINDSGEITGTWVDAAGILHGFLRAPDGTYTTIDDPDAVQSSFEGTQSFAINASGAIVGNYNDKNTGSIRAYVRDELGNYTNFDPAPGTQGVVPIAINVGGEIAGSYFDSGPGSHAFFRDASGVVTDFDLTNASDTVPFGMNDSGLIVGDWDKNGQVNGGFERDPSGTITSFLAPGPNQGTYTAGLNNKGKITGNYWDLNNTSHGFLR